MLRSRTTGLLVAVLAVCTLLVARRSLLASPDPDLVARWWVATSLATVMLLLAPRRLTRRLTALVALLFLVAGLLAGRGAVFAVGFALANVAECLIVVWFLTGFETERPGLRTWRDLRRWLFGITVAGVVAGVLTTATLGLTGSDDLWRPLLWVALTHVATQLVVLPLVLARPSHRVRVPVLEVAGHLLLVALAAAACVTAGSGQPVAFLLLPMLVWAAARFPQRWAAVELFVVALGLALVTAQGRGPFAHLVGEQSLLDIAASAQTFVVVSAVTSVTFTVAMSHLRDSLRTIREHEVQLGQLLDSASGTAFIATDLDGTITWFSPGAELLLGHRAEDVVGRSTPMPFHEAREVLARAQELGITPDYRVVTSPAEEGTGHETRDWTYVRKDGSRLTVSLSATAVRGEDGTPVSHLSVVRDVTDRRAAEQALVFALDRERETNQRMHELDRAKTEFVSSVSHELRTPLTSIVGYTELLTDEEVSENLTPMQRQLVERVERNGERLLALVEDLLTLARVEDGSFELERSRVDLRDAVRVATDDVSHAARKHRVQLEVSMPSEPVCVDGELAHLERLVLNLASNAVKFTPPGGAVHVRLTTDGSTADLEVTDTGMGIPQDEQPHVFQRFFRSTLATEQAIQGTGLGLSIVRAIAEAHGGAVTFDSTPGRGTTFRLSVPRSDGPVLARPARLVVLPEEELEMPRVPPRV